MLKVQKIKKLVLTNKEDFFKLRTIGSGACTAKFIIHKHPQSKTTIENVKCY